jgi:hypothetical protein
MFDLSPMNFPDAGAFTEVKVTLSGKDYILREATREQAARYTSAVVACSKFTKGDLSELKGIGYTDTLLLGMCLLRTDTNPMQPVGDAFVNQLRETVADKLVKKLKEISQINQPTTKKELLDRQAEIKQQLEEMDRKEANGPLTESAPSSVLLQPSA